MRLLSLIIFISLRGYERASKISHNIRWKRKVKKLLGMKSSKKLTTKQIKEIGRFYSKFGYGNISVLWHQFYFSCNGLFSEKYVPENLFYLEIEPKLNRAVYFPALEDKNILDRLFPKVKQPETIVKNINGFYYAENKLLDWDEVLALCSTGENFILKPTLETGGGKNVKLFSCHEGKVNADNIPLGDLLMGYKKDFIVQKVVNQHPKMIQLNSTSLNTFRVMTLLDKDKVDVISIIVRMGREGSITDNSSGGGLSCGVNMEGYLNEVGYQNETGKSFSTTDAGKPFKDVVLPFTTKVIDMAVKLHQTIPFFRLISWDFAVDHNEEAVLIEYNVQGQDINFHQLNNGPVLSRLLAVKV